MFDAQRQDILSSLEKGVRAITNQQSLAGQVYFFWTDCEWYERSSSLFDSGGKKFVDLGCQFCPVEFCFV